MVKKCARAPGEKMKKLLIGMLALSSLSSFAQNACLKEVRVYYSHTRSMDICRNVSDACFLQQQQHSSGPVQAANACRTTNIYGSACVEAVSPYYGFLAIEICENVNDSCFIEHQQYSSGPVQSANACRGRNN